VKYPLAESFVAPQGEGLFTGTTMLFLRLVGCSVGTKVCTNCDTDYDRMLPAMGGGLHDAASLVEMARTANARHVCLTGGEPMDRDIRQILRAMNGDGRMCHVETSGTVHPAWLGDEPQVDSRVNRHMITLPDTDDGVSQMRDWVRMWLTVSPKPGYLESMIDQADEVKVIMGGLGDGPGWPTVDDALRWADAGKLVYVQPRNHRMTINEDNMVEVIRVATKYPQLRVSGQLHKVWKTR
jgi:organic radical activating enzyme